MISGSLCNYREAVVSTANVDTGLVAIDVAIVTRR